MPVETAYIDSTEVKKKNVCPKKHTDYIYLSDVAWFNGDFRKPFPVKQYTIVTDLTFSEDNGYTFRFKNEIHRQVFGCLDGKRLLEATEENLKFVADIKQLEKKVELANKRLNIVLGSLKTLNSRCSQ